MTVSERADYHRSAFGGGQIICNVCNAIGFPGDVPHESRTDHIGYECPVPRLEAAEQEIKDWEESFDLYHEAEMRGIDYWRKNNPDAEERVWPDKGKLTAWLLDQLATAEQEIDRALIGIALADRVNSDEVWSEGALGEWLEENRSLVERARASLAEEREERT